MTISSSGRTACAANSVEIHRILGKLNNEWTARVLALNPSLADLEDAAICMTGDRDVLAKSGHHVSAIAAAILEILEADKKSETGKV